MTAILFRLGQALWWIGAIIGGAFALIGAFMLVTEKNDGGVVGAMMLGTALAVVAPCWTLAFVLAGSFWKPPRPQ